ncbi:uncharacterized protein LOC123269092 isoform X1 [Cotesia glomerata]|uniref:uncharacterized protein LOC123269092 isoform X1 n=1 Tax=Cotesia glomerata TaxID=32391 RepID=UPI001D033B1D|nr:uncharacterized protein LOC123269092 isoform X1 [Cotesia glomerata]
MLKVSWLVVLIFVIGVYTHNVTKLGKPCDGNHLPVGCGVNQECVFNTNKTFRCYCAQNFVESDGECLKISTTAAASIDPADQQHNKSSGNSVAIGLLIPTILIIVGGVGFCCARRYRLLPCRQNTYGNVLVTRDEDDDDDPPIA